jgi:hypothetical protein
MIKDGHLITPEKNCPLRMNKSLKIYRKCISVNEIKI